MSSLKRTRDVAFVVGLLVFPFFFLRANMKHPEDQGFLGTIDRACLRISAPVEYGAASLARGLSRLLGDYVYLVDVKADNERLAYDNARLKEEVRKLEAAQVENGELRRLLQLKQSIPGDAVSALVVGKDFTEFFRVTRVVLDRGSRDVRMHMPVVSPDGVVGTVLHVAGDSLDVQLAVDANFGVDVEDARTHARGYVRGTGDPAKYVCKVEMVDSTSEVEVGDLLITSGKGKLFPKGLPVAKVTKVTKRELGRDQEVEAAPTVDFSRLDAVLVLVTPPEELDGERDAREVKDAKTRATSKVDRSSDGRGK